MSPILVNTKPWWWWKSPVNPELALGSKEKRAGVCVCVKLNLSLSVHSSPSEMLPCTSLHSLWEFLQHAIVQYFGIYSLISGTWHSCFRKYLIHHDKTQSCKKMISLSLSQLSINKWNPEPKLSLCFHSLMPAGVNLLMQQFYFTEPSGFRVEKNPDWMFETAGNHCGKVALNY